MITVYTTQDDEVVPIAGDDAVTQSTIIIFPVSISFGC